MAGEWIKLRTNLWDDPRVARLCDLTDQPEAMVIGGLYWLWAMADEHTEDGLLPGLTLRAIDRKTGVPGLADALVQIGWLRDGAQGVEVVNFSEHNGESAKRRCADAKRKATVRNVSASRADKRRTAGGQVPDDGGTDAGQALDESVTGCGAREEKRREELKEHSLSSAGDPESAVEPLPATQAPEVITLDWQPDQTTLAAFALRAGVPVAEFTPEATAPFVLHHHGKGAAKRHGEWVAALVRWVLNDRQRAAGRVVPLRGAGVAPAEDWAEQGVML